MLLLLFNGGGGGIPAPDFSTLIATAPDSDFGYQIQSLDGDSIFKFVLELADPAALLWHDITDYYVGDRHQFGADDPFGRARARLITVQLQIDDDRLAPWGQDTTGTFGADVPLGAGLLMRLSIIRLFGVDELEWFPLWTGRVEEWGDASAARGQIRTHIISVVDSRSDLMNVPTTIPENSAEWPDWFTEQLLPAAGWSWGVDIYGDAADAGLPQDLNLVSAEQRMDQGTDPLGLTWRSLRTGRMVIHPTPWDTTNTERYDNPLLAVYPDGLPFRYSPDFSEIEYIADDDQQPFGVIDSSRGVLNYFVVTMPADEVYATDDPVSIEKHGVRPFQATWILSNPPVVDDLLTIRAFASKLALPLRVGIDHEGFWPALAMVDHLDPVTFVHQTSSGGLVVSGNGWIRNVVEERTWRGDNLLSWQSTVQIDVETTSTAEALLPVESLAFLGSETSLLGGPSSAEFSWTNPTQPSITPTEVQYRVIGRSLIWVSSSYPGVGADGQIVNWLEPATSYRFQVRLIRRVNGIVTNASPIREIVFTTAARILPIPIEGDTPTDTNVDMDDLPFDDCVDDVSIELQENDGSGWVTVDTFSGSEIEQDAEGNWHLVYDIPNSFFNQGSMYRWLGYCGAELIVTGVAFDPPDDWDDPCTIPPALSEAPYNAASLLVYVPQICAPDIIREYVSQLVAVHGDALEGIEALLTGDPNERVLRSIPAPGWDETPGGIVAYGECPQIVGVTGDKSIGCRVFIDDDTEDAVLFECAGMTLEAVPVSGGGWRAAVTVYTPGTTTTLPSTSVLAADTVYSLWATFEYATGTINLYVDAALEGTVGGTDNVGTSNVLPIWRAGVPPESWITDCAVFDEVIVPTAPPFDPTDIAGLRGWYDAADTATITLSGDNVTQWDDKSGADRHLTVTAEATEGPVSGSRTKNSLNVLDFQNTAGSVTALQSMISPTSILASPADAYSLFIVFVEDASAAELRYPVWFGGQSNHGIRIPASVTTAVVFNGSGGDASATGPATTLGTWRQVTIKVGDNGEPLVIRQDGAAGGSSTSNGSPVDDISMYVGSRSAAQRALDGAVAEILVYRPALGDTDRDLVETYLIDKWGI